jgi:hypothetical protein
MKNYADWACLWSRQAYALQGRVLNSQRDLN